MKILIGMPRFAAVLMQKDLFLTAATVTNRNK
jgi:hypothetical protein